MKKVLGLFFSLLMTPLAYAEEITIELGQYSNFSQSTLVVNQALGGVHSPLLVTGWTGASTPSLAVEVGDGQHGSFDSTTYQQFSEDGDVSGNIIRLNTETYPTLQVTNFHLAQGWTLQPIGDNPLIIYSLSDVHIEGTIDCSGDDGGDASGTTPGAGGEGRCGGADGGDGGTSQTSGEPGDDSEGIVFGGGAGLSGTPPDSGGGGGAWNGSVGNTPTAGFQANGGALAGQSDSDPLFDAIAGGAGGGGGAGVNAVSGDAGSGGGAGGGVVIIHAVRDFSLGSSPSSVLGFILANGGQGGGTGSAGGAGGGGGGGSIQVFAGRNIDLYNTYSTGGLGAGQAVKGDGGTNSSAQVAGNGGQGRNWYTSVNYNPSGAVGFYVPSEESPIVPGDYVQFSTAVEEAESSPIDLLSTKSKVESVTLSPQSSDFTVLLAGSNDNFQSDDSGWTTDLDSLNGKRFVKFKIQIQNSSATTINVLQSLTIEYTREQRDEFLFNAVGCGTVQNPTPPSLMFLIVILPLLFAFFFRSKNLKKL